MKQKIQITNYASVRKAMRQLSGTRNDSAMCNFFLAFVVLTLVGNLGREKAIAHISNFVNRAVALMRFDGLE